MKCIHGAEIPHIKDEEKNSQLKGRENELWVKVEG